MTVRLAPLEPLAALPSLSLLLCLPCLSLGRQRRLPAVRRVDDQRGLPRRLAGLLPVRRRRGRAADGARRGHVGGEYVDLGEERLLLVLDVPGALLELLLREHVARAEPRWTLQWHAHRLDPRP